MNFHVKNAKPKENLLYVNFSQKSYNFFKLLSRGFLLSKRNFFKSAQTETSCFGLFFLDTYKSFKVGVETLCEKEETSETSEPLIHANFVSDTF